MRKSVLLMLCLGLFLHPLQGRVGQLLSGLNRLDQHTDNFLNKGSQEADAGVAAGTDMLMQGIAAYGQAQSKVFQVAQKGMSVLHKARLDFTTQKKLLERGSARYSASLEKLFGLVAELLTDVFEANEEDEAGSSSNQERQDRRTLNKMLSYVESFREADDTFLKVLHTFFKTMGQHLGDEGSLSAEPLQYFNDVPVATLVEEGIDESYSALGEQLAEQVQELLELLGEVLQSPSFGSAGMDWQQRLEAEARYAAEEKLKLSQLIEPYGQLKKTILGVHASIKSLADKVLHEYAYAELKKKHRTMKDVVSRALKQLQSGQQGLHMFFTDDRLRELQAIRDISKYRDDEREKRTAMLLKVCSDFTKEKGRYLGSMSRIGSSIEKYLGIKAVVVPTPDLLTHELPQDVLQRTDLITLFSEYAQKFQTAFASYRTVINKVLSSPIGVPPQEFVARFAELQDASYVAAAKEVMNAQNLFILAASKITYGVAYPFVKATLNAEAKEFYQFMNEVFGVTSADVSEEKPSEFDESDSYDVMAEEKVAQPKKEGGPMYSTGRAERLELYKKMRAKFWKAHVNLLVLSDGAIGKKRTKKNGAQKPEDDADAYVSARDALQEQVRSIFDLGDNLIGKFPVSRRYIDSYTELKQSLLKGARMLHAVCLQRLQRPEPKPEPKVVVAEENVAEGDEVSQDAFGDAADDKPEGDDSFEVEDEESLF